jgi:hypothetical protein
MFAKIINNVVEKYPYSLSDLRKDNSNVSFPKNPDTETLALFNTFEVVSTPKPEVDYTQDIGEGVPQKINGVWTQIWNISIADEETLAERTENKAKEVRDERNFKLTQTDWTQILDAPVDRPTWAAYRQLLRDVPNQPGFPWDVSWPTKP